MLLELVEDNLINLIDTDPDIHKYLSYYNNIQDVHDNIIFEFIQVVMIVNLKNGYQCRKKPYSNSCFKH